MATASRQRVTVDLRGAADRLHAFAAARHMTTAAVVRMAIRQTLDGQVGADSTVTQPARTLIDRAAIKVTIRLAPEAATALVRRAHAADVSQGAYVAGLLEGSPPPMRPSDHGDAVAALAKSTDALAGLRVDLNAFTRMMRMAGANGLAGQDANLDVMSKQMLEHIAIAARLIIGLQPYARARRERLAAPRTSKRSS
ncbi:hypothetical protein [Scleromatobacter humisilvae]|uniref:Uncharacterized protein n=1 Tax=Scleromatobacter humisilvae TaxID=2897159 RepID=A0A9X2C469_9BURK|nr:hypothetical protein [Scleromatobacter humisilvae]MCK9689479.1 hypothetical protein [Scleromatobacter humisilvae]